MKMVKQNLKMVKYHPSHHPPIQTQEYSNEHFPCTYKNINTIQSRNMAYTQENIQFSESVVKYSLITFLNLLIDMGSLSGAGRLFHNIVYLNLIGRFPNVDCTEDTCRLLQFRVL